MIDHIGVPNWHDIVIIRDSQLEKKSIYLRPAFRRNIPPVHAVWTYRRTMRETWLSRETTSPSSVLEHRLMRILLFFTVLFVRNGYCQNVTEESAACEASGGTTPEVQAQRIDGVPTYLNVMSSIGKYDNITL